MIFGAALLYGDGVITPAISVLSAVEGLEVATTALKPGVVPLTCLILIGVFLVQKQGTAGIGRVFGPIMLVWFLTIALLGVPQIVDEPVGAHGDEPDLRRPVLPRAEVPRFPGARRRRPRHHRRRGALRGHGPLRAAPHPARLVPVRHAGPAPQLLRTRGARPGARTAATNPFYALVPSSLIYPMVALATMATIIASQALISGAFSLTRQAIQLGFFPRVTIVHTSGEAEGQIYIPEINAALMVSCIWLVLSFKESTALASAYGIAVTGTMAITSIIYYVVVTRDVGLGPLEGDPARRRVPHLRSRLLRRQPAQVLQRRMVPARAWRSSSSWS